MKFLTAIAFWVAAAAAYGQLTARWDTDSIRIGEQAVLKLQLRSRNARVNYRPFSAEIPCEMKADSAALTQDGSLEIIGAFRDTTYKKNGFSYWEGSYTVTAWDTGVYIAPVIFVSPEKGDTVYSVQPKRLTVSFVKKKVSDDIEEVPVELEEDPLGWLKSYWWIILPILLFAIAVVVILIVIRRKNKLPPVPLSLKDRTLKAIAELRKKAYWQKGRINEHYIEFSFLIRSFLSERYALNLMERTTYETMLLLRTKEIPEATLERIRRLLQESDMVKFAMGTPDEESILLGMNYFEELLLELSPLELIA